VSLRTSLTTLVVAKIVLAKLVQDRHFRFRRRSDDWLRVRRKLTRLAETCWLRRRSLTCLVLIGTGSLFQLIALASKFTMPLGSIINSGPFSLNRSTTSSCRVLEKALPLCKLSTASSESALRLSDRFIEPRGSRCLFVEELAGIFVSALIPKLALIV